MKKLVWIITEASNPGMAVASAYNVTRFRTHLQAECALTTFVDQGMAKEGQSYSITALVVDDSFAQ